MYDLHNRHGQFSGSQFLITLLKASKDISLLN